MKRLWLLAAMAVSGLAHAQPGGGQAPQSPRADHRTVITNPDWVRVPSGDEFASYSPYGATTTGNVRLECDVTVDGRVTGCIVSQENPTGAGFGKAALKMSRLFRMKPQTRDGVPVGGGVVTIPIRFGVYGLESPPKWVRLPTPEELLSVWPPGAPETGGVATISCVVTPKGQARSCGIVSETPQNSGFAAAAIKLSPKFQLTPSKGNGGVYPLDSIAQLTIAFQKPQPTQTGAGEFGDITSLHNAPWHATPTTAEMAAAWPSGAPAGLEEVKVRVQCGFSPDTSLTGCRLLSEDPAGYGLSAAALKLTERFRTRGALMEDALLAKARIFLTFDFQNPKNGGADPVWLEKPNWVSFIPADRMTELYPAAAADSGIKTGRGVVTCTIAPDGALTACSLESEDPPGKGFGQAALAAITSFAVNPWSDEGRPVDGSKIRVPIRFNEVEPEPPPASAQAPGAPAPAAGQPKPST